MDSDSEFDQPCKKRCTEKDKLETNDETPFFSPAIANGSDQAAKDKINIGQHTSHGTIDNVEINSETENEDNGIAQDLDEDSSSRIEDENDEVQDLDENSSSRTEDENDKVPDLDVNSSSRIENEYDKVQDLDENSRSRIEDENEEVQDLDENSRSNLLPNVLSSDILVDWVTSQNITSLTRPLKAATEGLSDVENMPSCSNDIRYNRPSDSIVDDTGEVIPVENLYSSSSDSSDSDSSSNQIDTTRSNSSRSTFRIQPSRHTEMTLTFGGTGSRSNMTHTVLLGDGCNSRQSVKYVFNFRSMSDSATQTDPQMRVKASDALQDENNSTLQFDLSEIKPNNCSSNDDLDMHINRLPYSIILQIFKSLSMHELLCKASLVCKTWYNLCQDPDLWRSVDLSHQHKVDDNILKKLTDYSDRVISLNLEDTKVLTSHGISLVCVKCKNLQNLRLTRCFSVENDVLMMVGTSCRNLQCLNLDGCYRISDQWTCSVGEGCPQLRELVLGRCSQMTDVGICRIAENCHHLQNIVLDHCNKVTDHSVRMLAENCPELKTLSLANCNITDTGICSIYKMKKLEYLDISNLPGGSITAAVVSQLTRLCDNLECLNLSLNLTIDDRCIQEIARYGQRMKKLFCVNCSLTDEGLLAVAAHGRSLEKLDLGWCKDLTDRGVWALIDNCPALKYIGLIRCDSVSEKGVEAMVDRYPHIQFSTFFMESRKLIQKAIANGFKFMAESEQNK